jgi:hypothetical protein
MRTKDRRTIIVGLAAAIGIAAAVWFIRPKQRPHVSAPLDQDVYVWQRSWSPAVRTAVRERGAEFGEIVALVAEVTWKNGEGKSARVRIDSDALRASGRSVGIAMRVNPFEGPKNLDPFDSRSAQTKFLCDLAADSIERIKADSITPAELQIDFDCPESKLAAYRNWVIAIRRRIAPVRLSITTLPSALDSPDFEDLVRQCDSYVLQVHSVKRPTSLDRMPVLCDADQSRRWVRSASQIGVPFRVALPTYAYRAEFDAKGKCLRLAGEGAALKPPPGGCVRQIAADAKMIAGLVHEWTIDRPDHLSGVIWYRLPNDDDDLNWRWPTLAAVMKGQAPQERDANEPVLLANPGNSSR